jgi:hypothetical protein
MIGVNTMAEYIEREALMRFPIRLNHYDKEHGNEHFVLGIESVLEYAESLPTADVAEVRHGEWKIKRDEYDCEYMVCSCCGECFYDGDNDTVDRTPKYCSECGARMDGKGEDDG